MVFNSGFKGLTVQLYELHKLKALCYTKCIYNRNDNEARISYNQTCNRPLSFKWVRPIAHSGSWHQRCLLRFSWSRAYDATKVRNTNHVNFFFQHQP